MHKYINQKLGLLACISFVLLTASLLVLAGTAIHSSKPVSASYNDLEVKTNLLTAALDEVGVCGPREAALLWAKGVKQRNAALQYAVLSHELKLRYAKAWEQTAPGWVTGVSSPWISEYKIIDEQQKDDIYTYILEFTAATSTGVKGVYGATLTVAADGGYWRISHIDMDEALNVYTGVE